jgi:small subunit ribosomal protein S20
VANIKSQKKRVITNEKRHQRNRAVKSSLKTAIKKVNVAIEAGDAEAAKTAAVEASALLDKAASKGIIHKNQAANRKSGIMKAANGVG